MHDADSNAVVVLVGIAQPTSLSGSPWVVSWWSHRSTEEFCGRGDSRMSGVEYVCPSTLSTVSFRSPEGGQKKTGMG